MKGFLDGPRAPPLSLSSNTCESLEWSQDASRYAHGSIRAGLAHPETRSPHALSRAVQILGKTPLEHGTGRALEPVPARAAVRRAGAHHQDERHHRMVGAAG